MDVFLSNFITNIFSNFAYDNFGSWVDSKNKRKIDNEIRNKIMENQLLMRESISFDKIKEHYQNSGLKNWDQYSLRALVGFGASQITKNIDFRGEMVFFDSTFAKNTFSPSFWTTNPYMLLWGDYSARLAGKRSKAHFSTSRVFFVDEQKLCDPAKRIKIMDSMMLQLQKGLNVYLVPQSLVSPIDGHVYSDKTALGCMKWELGYWDFTSYKSHAMVQEYYDIFYQEIKPLSKTCQVLELLNTTSFSEINKLTASFLEANGCRKAVRFPTNPLLVLKNLPPG